MTPFKHNKDLVYLELSKDDILDLSAALENLTERPTARFLWKPVFQKLKVLLNGCLKDDVAVVSNK